MSEALKVEAEIKSEGLPEKESRLLECLARKAKLKQMADSTAAALVEVEREKTSLLAEIERARR